MRCLVTGGLGFIGLHLVERLRALGHDVYVIDDGSHASGTITHKTQGRYYPAVELGEWLLTSSASDFGFDWVFHLAAVSRTSAALRNPSNCYLVNASISLLLLSHLHEWNPKARVVMASSNVVYFPPNPYRASKLAMEEYMSAYNECYGLNCVALRYSNVYGPRMRWDDSICLAAMRRSAVERGYIELTGDGQQSRDFTHVSDIVEGTILAAQSEYKGILDLSSGQHRSMAQMAEYFNVPVRFIPARTADAKEVSQGKAAAITRAVLRWAPKVSISDGMRDVLVEVPATTEARVS